MRANGAGVFPFLPGGRPRRDINRRGRANPFRSDSATGNTMLPVDAGRKRW
jgi:hypothetical protein